MKITISSLLCLSIHLLAPGAYAEQAPPAKQICSEEMTIKSCWDQLYQSAKEATDGKVRLYVITDYNEFIDTYLKLRQTVNRLTENKWEEDISWQSEYFVSGDFIKKLKAAKQLSVLVSEADIKSFVVITHDEQGAFVISKFKEDIFKKKLEGDYFDLGLDELLYW